MNEAKKLELKEYRRLQALFAVWRDNGLCVICYFKYNRQRKCDDVHHVYGRGRDVTSWRENYRSLMCTCRECHPQPVSDPQSTKNQEIVALLEKANKEPINKGFIGGE